MRSVRPGVRESRGCAVLAVLASDQRGALGASLLAPKAPRPSPGLEGLLLSARGLSRRDQQARGSAAGQPVASPTTPVCSAGAAEPNDSPRQSPSHARGPKPPRRARRARGCKRPLGKTVLSKALLQPPPPDTRRPDQNFIIGFAMNRSTLSWCPSWFQHSGCAMFTFVRG
jgi:hypothetical protein